MEDMENNVLTDKQRNTLRRLEEGSFSGHISIEDRAYYESIYSKHVGKPNVCWTCGNSMKNFAKQLMNKLR